MKINFLSAFPPMIHEIGSYTNYLMDCLYEKKIDCEVIGFNLNSSEFLKP